MAAASSRVGRIHTRDILVRVTEITARRAVSGSSERTRFHWRGERSVRGWSPRVTRERDKKVRNVRYEIPLPSDAHAGLTSGFEGYSGSYYTVCGDE